MDRDTNYWAQAGTRRSSRRALLRAASYSGGGLAAALLVACGGGSNNNNKNGANNNAGSAPAGGASSAATRAASGATAAAAGATAAVKAATPTGIETAAPSPNKLGDKLMMGWPFFPRQYDAHTALGPEIWHVIGSRAIRRNAKTGALIPDVAASWEIADPSGTQLMIKIRPDVATHDKAPCNGRMFSAEDFAYNLTRITGALDPANKAQYQRAATLTGMDSATAVDATTVQIKMSTPNSGFFNGLAEFRNVLMPKDTVEQTGFANPAALSGTGPFVVQEFEDYKVAHFTRHPKYYVQNEPHFQDLNHITTIDPSAVISAFLSKQTAMISVANLPARDALQNGRKDASFVQTPGLNWYHLRFNTKKAPFSDPRVRQALSLVIDREALAKARWGTLQWALTAPLVPAFPEALTADQLKTYPGFNSPTKPQDIAQAQALLTAAGVSKIEANLLPATSVPTDEWYENAVRVKDQIEKALSNVKLNLTPPADTAAFSQQQASGNFDLISYTITTLPDPVLEFISQYHTGGSRNYGAFSDPDADAMIDKALGTLDLNARSQILHDFQDTYLKKWLPAVQFYVNPDARYVDPHYVLENNDQLVGPWNPAGTGYGEQGIQYWMPA
jgi:ABC-type transport system substrate-binding protein